MSQLAIGIIETVGLAAAIEAADVCVKSANVELIGYELSKGSGMAVVKIEGNVGAVQAATEAAVIAANKVSSVFSKKVIPRPSDCIEPLIKNQDTVGYANDKADEFKEDCTNIDENNTSVEIKDSNEESIEEEIDIKTDIYKEDMEQGYIDIEDYENVDYTCNLCKDPKCPRQKGELKNTCIHYSDEDK